MTANFNNFKKKITPEMRRPGLKKTLREKSFIRLIEVHNGISALIAENASAKTTRGQRSFDALWISSLTDSVAKGYPDEEIVSIDSRIDTANQVINVTAKPLMYDADTGGFPEQLICLIRRLERIGVSAVVLEDKKYPKSNSLLHMAKHNLESVGRFVEKIKYAKGAQVTEDFMIIGRIESLIIGESQKNALKRAQAYLKAGADGIMIHSKSTSPKEVLNFAKAYNGLDFLNERKPLMCVPTTYNSVKEEELIGAGFNIVLYANHLLRSSFCAMQKTCQLILERGRAKEADNALCASIEEILAPVGSMRTYLAEYKTKKTEN